MKSPIVPYKFGIADLPFKPKPGSDMTPYLEPFIIEVEDWNVGGWRVKARLKIDFRWDTKCEWIETNRIFGHKGELSEDEIKKEFVTAIRDLKEKLDWIYQANHGMFDKNGNTIRFKA